MKEAELRKYATCSICRKKIGASGLPLFWRVSIERFGLNGPALQRQQGLTMMLGGHAQLAAVMGPDEDMTKPVMDKVTLSVCETCATEERYCIGALAEMKGVKDQ